MENELVDKIVAGIQAKLAGTEENQQGDLERTFSINYGHYREVMVEWKAQRVPGSDKDLGQIVLRRPESETIEHYYFTERGVSEIIVEKSDETVWNDGSDQYGTDDAEEMQEVVNSEEDAANMLGGNSDERRPVDKSELEQLLGLLESIKVQA